LPSLNYWQAWGIFILAKILFGGVHGSRGHGPGHRHKHHLRERIREMEDKETPEAAT
jgi:hypothetical protein